MTSIDRSRWVNAPQPALALGRCPECGTVVAREGAPEQGTAATCTKCNTTLAVHGVTAKYSEAHPCDDRCQYAAGPVCSCNCGGVNHGRGYIVPTLVPNWVRDRDLAAFQAAEQRRADKAAAARRAVTDARDALMAAHPLLADLATPDPYNDFLLDLSEQLERTGYLSDRQVAAAERAIQRDRDRETRRQADLAAQAAARAAGVEAPTGRTVVTGTVVHVKDELDYHGYTETLVWKMLVRVDADPAWTVWGTVPRDIRGSAMEHHGAFMDAQPADYDGAPLRDLLMGATVTFTATLAASKNNPEPLKRYATRPTKGTVTLAPGRIPTP